MAVQLLACPLCSQPGFTTLDSLREGLISAASRQLICPVCHDVLLGLDKFTIHLFSHCAQSNVNCLSLTVPGDVFDPVSHQNIADYNPISTSKLVINRVQADTNPQKSTRNTFMQTDPKASTDQSGKAGIQQMSATYDVSTSRPNLENICFDSPLALNVQGTNVDIPSNVIALSESQETLPNSIQPEYVSTTNETLGHSNPRTSKKETRCDLCGISFNDPKVLLMHKDLVHSPSDVSNTTERKNFGCFLCSKVFKMRGSLMVHLRVAHGASNVGNSLVAKSTPTDVEERPVVCNTCGKSFTKEQHLNQHMKTHEEKQWACDVCQKMFTTKYFLKKHKRLHTGEMPYSCNICHKAFTFQQSMHKHALYHSNDKPHSCPDCHRTFKELSTLTNHRRIHSDSPLVSCKCFRQRVSYLVHRRIHTGVMPYQCTACGKSFRYKVSERTHKCPSQPPGTIVRQAGELLQKLQEKAAAQSSDAMQDTRHVSGGSNQQQIEPRVNPQSLASQTNREPPTMLLMASPSNHLVKGDRSEPSQTTSTSCIGLLQQQSNNLPAVDTQSLVNIANQQLKGSSSQFIIILDNLQSARNVLVTPSVVETSSQTLRVSSCLPPGFNETIWCPQSGANVEECHANSVSDKLFASSKWTDPVFMDERPPVSENVKAEQKRNNLLYKKEGSRLESKRLDLEMSESPDFFSVLEDLPSPSERLRNLTISPSLKNLKTQEMKEIDEFSYQGTASCSQNNSKRCPDTLQTINEESLKQLLYGTSSGET